MIEEIEDFYNHNEADIIYVKKNIILKELENSLFCRGCTCNNICNTETNCECIRQFGKSYDKIDSETQLITNQYILNDKRINLPIYECNINCSCNRLCGNRLVQYGPRTNLQLIKCNKGLGLITKEFIHHGMFICEYAGEVITKQSADIRRMENRKNHRMNYILEFNENFGTSKYCTIVDPSTYGNIGRYLNHSCEPNCLLISVRVNEFIPKICIFALKDIQPLEEITFDYGENDFDPKQNLVRCLCNKVKCREWLPFLN